MAAQSRTLASLAAILVAAIGAVLWFALFPGPTPDAGPEDAAAPSSPDASSAAAGTKTSRAPRTGTAAVFGEIRRSKGRAPVVGQAVELRPERGEPWTVATDAQGAFRIDKVAHGGPYELRVTAKGCGAIRLPGIALSRNEQRNVGTLFLDPAVRVTVRVRTYADLPVADATVEAFAVAQSEDWDWSKSLVQMAQAPLPVAKATTDAKGEAVFPELAAGPWTFTARKDGMAGGGRPRVSVRSDVEPQPVVIHLASGSPLAGRVLDPERRPVADALVLAGSPATAWDPSSAPLRQRTTTDAEGHYAFPALEPGDTTLWVARAGAPPMAAATVRVPLVATYDIVLRAMGTLAGKVTEQANGGPVEGAVVRMGSWGIASFGAEATTDADGRYAIQIPEGTVNQLTAEKEGWVQIEPARLGAGRPQFLVQQGATVTRDLVLGRGATVWGLVTRESGPLAGAKIFLQCGNPWSGWKQRTATADETGRFEFPAVTPGTALLQPSKEGYFPPDLPANWWEAIQQQGAAPDYKIDVPVAGEIRKDLRLAKGVTVEGVVQGPEGSPLAGVRVAGPGAPESAPTGTDGAFRVEGVTPGPAVTLWPAKEGLVAASNKSFALSAETGASGILLRMTREAHVRGKVVAVAGAELRDACVLVGDWEQDMEAPWRAQNLWQNARRTPVRADGSYDALLTGRAAGKFVVRAVAVDLQVSESKIVDVLDTQDVYELDLTLAEGRTLEGRVIAKGGAAMVGADVTVATHDDRYGRWTGAGADTVWSVTDADGRFSVPRLAPRKFDVRATAPRFVEGLALVDLARPAPVVIELAPELPIAGVAQFADGRPVEGVLVAAHKGDDQNVLMGNMQGGPGVATSERDGSFRLTGLGEGTYTVTAVAPFGSDVNVRTKRLDGVVAGTKNVRLVIEEGGTISGRVLDAKRQPARNVNVIAMPTPKPGGGWVPEQHNATTREDGTFVVTALGDGPYTLQVGANWGSGTGFRPVSRNDVAVGTKDLEFVLEEGFSISGTIVDADGKTINQQIAIQATRIDDDHQGPSNANTWAQNGIFTLSGLAPGNYRLELPAWGGPSSNLTLEDKGPVAAGTKDLRLVATKGITITGMVVDEAGAPLAGASLNANGKEASGANDWRYGQSKEDGTFELAGLRAGSTYTLRCSVADRVPAIAKDVVAGARDAKLVCVKGVESSGRVLDAAGAPLKNTRLSLRQKDGDAYQSATTDEDGGFTAKGLVAGTYEVSALRVKDGGSQEWKRCGTLTGGQSGVELRLTQ